MILFYSIKLLISTQAYEFPHINIHFLNNVVFKFVIRIDKYL